jgi:cytochrome b pre-mRNA-processing protein 3
MILPLFRRSEPTIAALYGAIVTQARDPRFYEQFGVPDTVLGRFDLIVLHLALLLRRLRAHEGAGTSIAQAVFDMFCRDMDHNLREMGIGDQGVPHQMRRVGEAFYGRAHAYGAALAQPDDGALVGALRRNIYAEAPDSGVALPRLAAYVRQTVDALDAQDHEKLLQGTVSFPAPVVLASAAE